MTLVESLARDVRIMPACEALGVPRGSFYRWRHPGSVTESRPVPPLALSKEEQHAVLDVLHEDRFIDCAPREVYAALLDEGTYLCSVSTMYRILEQHDEVRERRDQLCHPGYKKPELLAETPRKVWSWDITKLKGPVKWSYFYLYVILDIFSRYVVGWMVAQSELASLAKALIEQTCKKQAIQPGELLIHADRGPSMRSKPVAFLLADLGVAKSHSRPYTSTDNPYSESQFKTMKYRPDFPNRFGSIQDARAFCQDFFTWYNKEHYHSGIGFLTPEDVHYGRADRIIKGRHAVLRAAFERHPERFKGETPKPMELPRAVWINKPLPEKRALAVH